MQTAKMGVLAILVVLKDANLQDEAAEQRSLAPINRIGVFVILFVDRSDLRKVDRDPAARLLELHVGELNKIVETSASPELHASRCVTLVVLKVEVDADVSDGNLLEEVYGQKMGLWTIALPEERG